MAFFVKRSIPWRYGTGKADGTLIGIVALKRICDADPI